MTGEACPNCGASTLVDDEGQIVCSRCGVVCGTFESAREGEYEN